MSSEPTVIVRFDDDSLVYQPGDRLSGEYWVESLDVGPLRAVEASVLWYTEGKGDEDMAVHEFWRQDSDDGQPLDPARPTPFHTTLPNSPLSYEGRIVKIRWCVRVRAFPARGKELVGERLFHLGTVPPIRTRPPQPASDAES